jgi:SAM-dependent methyltransferase
MDDYGPMTYGQRWADVYDEWTAVQLGDEVARAAVGVLADLAAGGRVLELAIGTGRLALPLAARGLTVQGIDASEQMVGKLREKEGGGAIPVTIGDFADVGVEGQFDLVFVAFNTFFALTTQDRQIDCFRNVAGHLKSGGVFVIEAFVPDMTRFQDHQTLRVNRMTTDEVLLDASRHDPLTQTVQSQEIVISEGEVRLRPVHLRYAWPSELDVMAQLAGLALRDRWGGWDRSPFTGSSMSHVSVYGRD